MNPAVAVGTDIAHGAIFKTVGAFHHRKMGKRARAARGLDAAGSAPMSLVGVWLANWLQDTYGGWRRVDDGRVLGGALLFGCIGLLAKSFIHAKPESDDEEFTFTNRDRAAAVLIGFFGGFVVGLTSVGSGVFFGLTLLVVFPLRVRTRSSGRTSSTLRRSSTSPASGTSSPATSTCTSSAGADRGRSRRAHRRTTFAAIPDTLPRFALATVSGCPG